MKNILKTFVLLLGVLFSWQGFGKAFQTEFLSFEIDDGWNCSQVPPNWVCEPRLASQRKFAIITVTSKEAGTLDQLSNFEAHLSKPRSHQLGSNTPVMSQVMKTNRRELNGHVWVQSLHLNSEVNGFYTLYLATVKKPLAVMVTMSGEKEKWDQFNSVFEKVIRSLSLKTVSLPKAGTTGGGPNISPQTTTGAQPGFTADGLPLENQPSLKLPMVYIVGLLVAGLVLLAAVYLFLKK